MKITSIKVVGRGFPEEIALIEVETDAGVTGIGATAAWIPAVSALIEKGTDRGGLEALLLGEDPTEPAGLWHKMVGSGAFGRACEGGLTINAMSAIDMALWDIAGKAAGLPIYKLLGGAVQREIMVYASTSAFAHRIEPGPLRRRSIDEMTRECRIYCEQGLKAIKLGWGNYFAPQDEEMLSAVRETIGPDVHLMLDFGCPAYLTPGWTAKDAVRIAGIAEKYDIFFLEEALKPDDVDGFAALTARANIKIATGESLTTLTEFQRFIDRRALDVIQPDAQQIGITQFVRVAYSAEKAGILCIPHCPWSPMAVAAHLQVLSGTTNGIMIEYPAFEYAPLGSYRRTWLESIHRHLIEHPLTVRDGYLQLPERPGLGLGQYVPEAIAAMEGLNPRE